MNDKNLMKDEDKLRRVNEMLELVMSAEPLTEYSDSQQETAEMLYGLAQMYANKGYRDYLIMEINKATKGAALRTITLVDVAFAKSRILTLKEQLIKAKHAYEQLEKLKALKAKK